MTNSAFERDCFPTQCTLPTEEVPVRVAEFADVLAWVRTVERLEPTRLLLRLRSAPGRASVVRDLASRESKCCSFFEFAIEEDDDQLVLDVSVPPEQVQVLQAMAHRAGRPSRAADRS